MSHERALNVGPLARRELLRLAREALSGYVRDGTRGDWTKATALAHHGLQTDDTQVQQLDVMMLQAGAFVSLHHGEDLRGCIGYLEAREPLWRTVRDAAIAAATTDPRFPPVSTDEVAGLDIEISVLSPIERCPNVDEIEIGRDGLVIRQGSLSGLLLPQVPVDWGWTREQFLAHTCRKAGLPLDAYKTGAQVYWFTATIFGDSRTHDSAVRANGDA